MNYEKPALFALSCAANAVRMTDTGTSADDGSKGSAREEASSDGTGTDNTGHATSSTAGAYEADE